MTDVAPTPKSIIPSTMPRCGALDALRGVGALAVPIYHVAPSWLPQGHLAVDFFFVLSGLVVAQAYGADLTKGTMSWRGFAMRRILRLYPLALLGVALGAIHLAVRVATHSSQVDDPIRLLASLMFNAVVLPMPFGSDGSQRIIFPGNAALWTLFFEFLANFVWASYCIGLRRGSLALVVIASAAAVIAAVVHWQGADLGFNMQTLLGGLARVAFGFGLGVLMERMPRPAHAPSATSTVFLAFVLTCIFALPANALGHPVTIPLGSILIVMPVVVWVAAGVGSVGRFGTWLGDVSYPIYATHLPVAEICMSALHRLAPQLPSSTVAIIAITISVSAGIVALYAYDEPFRHRLALIVRRRGLIKGRVRSEEGA